MSKRELQAKDNLKMDDRSREERSGRFDFLSVAKYITAFSILLTLVSFAVIVMNGFIYGVDFAGGTEIQVSFPQPVPADKVRAFTDKEGFKNSTVQGIGADNRGYLIRLDTVLGKTDQETNENMKRAVRKATDGLTSTFPGATIDKINTIGPQAGSELRKNGILAGFYCLLLILIYVGLRFDYKYAPGTIFCLIHDSIITLGIYSFFHWEVTTQTMAAILTIIGYSMNDTLVIFDRIRENEGIYKDKSIAWISNRSINETLSRTILTYLTVFITVLSMFFLANGVIKEFARAMLVGMTLGIYSTVYVATPAMLWLDRYQKHRTKK